MAQSAREIYWSAILADFRRLGLTHVEFCKLRRVSIHSFRDWLYRLRPGLPPPRPRVRSQHSPSALSEAPSPTFLPVHVRPEPKSSTTSLSHTGPASPLELVLAEDLRIRLPADFDAASLHRLLDVLEQRPC